MIHTAIVSAVVTPVIAMGLVAPAATLIKPATPAAVPVPALKQLTVTQPTSSVTTPKAPSAAQSSAKLPDTQQAGGTQQKAAAANAVIHVRAFNDLNGDRSYTYGNEGKEFAGYSYRIKDVYGTEINYASACNDGDNKFGPLGHEICNVVPGFYSVQMLGVNASKYFGPLKGQYNAKGENPIAVAAQANQQAMVDFMYAEKGLVMVRAYVDMNGNDTYDNLGGEGHFFYNKQYTLFDIQGQPVNDNCSVPDPDFLISGHLGGAGRGYCEVPTGTYEVHVYGVESNIFRGPEKIATNPNGTNPMYVVVQAGKTSIADFQHSLIAGTLAIEAANSDLPRPNSAFANYSFTVKDNAGRQIDYYRFCYGKNNKLDANGKATCWVPQNGNSYSVELLGVNPSTWQGPAKSRWNSNGTNPVSVNVPQAYWAGAEFFYHRI